MIHVLGTMGNSGPFSIGNYLSASLSAYNAASAGTWVPITSSEYALMASAIDVSRVGMADSVMSQAVAAPGGGYFDGRTASQGLGGSSVAGTINANSYLFAFTVKTNSAGSAGARVYVSSSVASTTGSYTGYGNGLSAYSSGQVYFALKTPTLLTSAGLLAFYHANTGIATWGTSVSAGTVTTAAAANSGGNGGNLTNSAPSSQYVVQIQGLIAQQWQ